MLAVCAVADQAHSQQRRTGRLLPIELVLSRLASDSAAVANRAHSQQLGVGQCGCCRPSSFGAAWGQCLCCRSSSISVNTRHSARHAFPARSSRWPRITLCLAQGQAPLIFLCAEPEGVLTMQSHVLHITHPHLHEPREHQQHELIPHQLAHLAQQCGRFCQVAEQSSLVGMEPKQSMSAGSEPARSTPRTSSCSTGSDGDLTTALSTSQSCERSDHCLGTTCGSTRHLRRDSQNRGAIDTSLFSDPAVRGDPMRGFSEEKIEQRRGE